MRRGNPDGNHLNVKHGLERAGCTVIDMKALGNGVPDLLVGIRGKTFLLEVKNPLTKGKLLESQKKFMSIWRGIPIIVVEGIVEALVAVGLMNQSAPVDQPLDELAMDAVRRTK